MNLIFVNFILNLDRNSVFPCLELVVVDTKTIFERRILESCNKAKVSTIDLLLLIGPNSLSKSILTLYLLLKIMRGRWASAALGAGIARRRAGREMEQQQG